ncbi:MAG: hypothetical protein ACFB0G_23305 [Leptolyngbyaceae cyanobacterium]
MTLKFPIGYLSKLLLAVMGTSTVLIGHPHLAQAQTTPVSATVDAQTAIADLGGSARLGVPGVVPVVPGVIPSVPGEGVIPGVVPGVGVVPVVPSIVPGVPGVMPGMGTVVPVVPGIGVAAVPNIGGVASGGRGVGIPNVGGVSQPGARGVGIALPR